MIEYVLQAAADTAAAKILAGVPVPVGGAKQGREALSWALCDCVYALCRWRDEVARAEDEGTKPLQSMYFSFGISPPFLAFWPHCFP
jgi:hypothetical protein